MTLTIRHDWCTEEIQTLLELPLMELLWRAQTVHREANPGYRVQLASLLSVKTGGCEEDCAYCSQSIYNSSDLAAFEAQMQVEPVLKRARIAKEAGADRFCMGWAWREIRDGAPFEAMLEIFDLDADDDVYDYWRYVLFNHGAPDNLHAGASHECPAYVGIIRWVDDRLHS